MLKNNGKIVITSPINNIVWDVIWFFWVHTFGKKWLGLHSKPFNKEELARKLKILSSERSNVLLNFVIGVKS